MPGCAPAMLLWGQWNLLPFVPSQCVLPDGDIPCSVAICTQVLSEASPAGLALGSAGPVLHSPCPRHGGALPLEGLPPKAAGTEMLQFPAPLIGAAGLARIPQGSARSPRLPFGQDHTSEMPDLTPPGALQQVPNGVHSDVPKLALGL